MNGKVVKRPGRKPGFSKRLDAVGLFGALQHLGVGYREAESAVEALLGVDPGELARGRTSEIKLAGTIVWDTEGGVTRPIDVPDPMVYGAIALTLYLGLIKARIADPSTGAAGTLADLPVSARNWVTMTLG